MNHERLQHLARLAGRAGQVLIGEEFYIYSTGRLAAITAAGGTLTNNITVQSDSDFLIEKMTYASDVAGASEGRDSANVPNVTALLTATGSGKQLMNVQAPIFSLFGTGELPFIMPISYFLPAASTLTISLTSFEASVTPRITLDFIGRKLYWGNAPPPQQQR